MSKDKKIKKQTQFNKVKMDDVKVFEQFKRQKLFQNITFVFVALTIGFGINEFMLDWDLGKNLQANLLQSQSPQEHKANIYLQTIQWAKNDVIQLKVWKNISNVKTLSLSLVYNPDVVSLADIFSNIPSLELSPLQNEPWIATLILTFSEAQNITQWKNILNFYVSKNKKITQHINVINANFTDTENINYELTTSGIAF